MPKKARPNINFRLDLCLVWESMNMEKYISSHTAPHCTDS
jgi:hypothetical protein